MNDEETYQDEAYEEPQGEGYEEPEQSAEAQDDDEPADLEAAFKLLNKGLHDAAQNSVEDSSDKQRDEGADEQPGGDADSGQGYQLEYIQQPQQQAQQRQQPAYQQTQQYDYSGAMKYFDDQSKKQAVQAVAKRFKDAGIEKANLGMLVERDERTGEVTFKNPDSPGRKFSGRKEAQDWVESFNKQVDAEFRNAVNKEYRDSRKGSAPTMNLLRFANEFMSMTPQEQDVLDDIVDQYAVRNRKGQVVGYSCNLQQAAQQARKIAARYSQAYSQQPQQRQQQAPAKRPATKMKTSSTGKAPSKEPTNLEEAMRIYQQLR